MKVVFYFIHLSVKYFHVFLMLDKWGEFQNSNVAGYLDYWKAARRLISKEYREWRSLPRILQLNTATIHINTWRNKMSVRHVGTEKPHRRCSLGFLIKGSNSNYNPCKSTRTKIPIKHAPRLLNFENFNYKTLWKTYDSFCNMLMT